jgi:hypothetical protein
MLVNDSNQNLGTGSLNQNSFFDSNYLLISGSNSLSKLTISIRDPSNMGGETIEVYIAKFDINPNVSIGRGNETNYVVLINESFVLPLSSSNLIKNTFTINPHNLGPNSGILIAYRQTTGSTFSQIQGVQFILDFN